MCTPGARGLPTILLKMTTTPLNLARNIIELLPTRIGRPKGTWLDGLDVLPPEEPLYPPEEIYGILPASFHETYDVREVIARLVDGSRFQEFKARYGATLVCGFAQDPRLPGGHPGEQWRTLLRKLSIKGTHFIELCEQRGGAAFVLAEHNRFYDRARV